MDAKKDTTDGSNGKTNGELEVDCTNTELVTSQQSLVPIPEAGVSRENGENSDTGPIMAQTNTSETAEGESSDNSETKSTNTLDAMLGEQTKGIVHKDVKVKNASGVQVGNNNVISYGSWQESEDSAIVGATASLPQPGKVIVYRNIQIENCKFVQVGDNNRMVIEKATPQADDAFVRVCCELDIDPEKSDSIYERLCQDTVRKQFAKMMAERYQVTCSMKSATKGCILLELEVPTEEDRLQLLRMARDGTFQQVLLETFLPELEAEGRAVNMNLAIGVRNPSQAMVEELQGATASSDHEDVVVVEIPVAASDPASQQNQPESAEGSPKQSDDDVKATNKGQETVSGKEVPDSTDSTATAFTEDVSTMKLKLLSEADDGEDEISVSVEGYAVPSVLGTGAAAANFPQEEFDEKFLTCEICQNIFDNPRVLPCLHTFCARCLERWRKGKNQFTCPTCRHQVSLQGKDVTSLPPNFYINNLLDFRALQSSEEAHSHCQMCESVARIEGTCADCRFLLCKNCITAHSNIPTLKDHYIITLHDLKNPNSRLKYTQAQYCPQHTDQQMTFYCQPCAQLVCQACTVDEHRPGPNHDPREVSKVAQEVKGELQTLVEQILDTAEDQKATDSTVTMEITRITTNCDKEEKKIQEHFAQLRTKLDEEEQKLQHKLREMEATQKEPLLKEKEGLEETLRSTEEGLELCTEILVRGNDVEIVTLRQQLAGKLKSLTATKTSHKTLEKDILFLPNIKMLTCNPGAVSLLNTEGITVTEPPVESLPTNIIFRPQADQDWGTPQVTVTSPGGQDAMLDTKETSERVFEAVWRPQTSGRHEVKVTGGEATGGGVSLCSHLTVDVGSNNPVLRFGQKGSQQGQFNTPVGVAVRGDRLYVADYGNKRVQVFDLSGKFFFSFSTTANAIGLAVHTDGTIVVRSGQEVMKFSPSGELINTFPLGEYCTKPYDLAVQRDGRVVVADRDKHSIFLFEADGTLVKQVGGQGQGEGQFNKPLFVCVDKEDNIIVADKENHRVQVFDRSLNFQHKFGQKGRQPEDMWGPVGVSVDSRGNIVFANLGGITHTVGITITDGVGHSEKIQVFRPNGTWLSTISSDGDKLNKPHGVAVTEDGHVFVADTKDHCIRKYRYM
ncbi:uncharacterized protein LOC144866181 [Branchiostoma floridae x Branchiostoma japonicum]